MRNRILSVAVLACFLTASLAMADVTLTQRKVANAGRKASAAPKVDAKMDKKAARHRGNSELATGSVQLIDSAGFKWFINTNITFSTSSSASAGMSEASYTHAVAASTSLGGTSATTLNDSYDGYQSMCISLTGATGPCATGNANYVMYNKTGGPAVPDAACANRQYIFPAMVSGGVSMQRKVFVPANDHYARWMNIFTNTTGAPITFHMITSNNLGSDSNTRIVTSSNGNNTAEVGDTWITSFQNWSGGTSSDPRLGHVIQGAGGTIPVSGINFVDGDDNPYWSYAITLNPGETKSIMNFGVTEPTKAAAAAISTQLASLSNPNALSCLSAVEAASVGNFNAQLVTVPAVSPVGLALLGLALAVVGFVVVRRLI